MAGYMLPYTTEQSIFSQVCGNFFILIFNYILLCSLILQPQLNVYFTEKAFLSFKSSGIAQVNTGSRARLTGLKPKPATFWLSDV